MLIGPVYSPCLFLHVSALFCFFFLTAEEGREVRGEKAERLSAGLII